MLSCDFNALSSFCLASRPRSSCASAFVKLSPPCGAAAAAMAAAGSKPCEDNPCTGVQAPSCTDSDNGCCFCSAADDSPDSTADADPNSATAAMVLLSCAMAPLPGTAPESVALVAVLPSAVVSMIPWPAPGCMSATLASLPSLMLCTYRIRARVVNADGPGLLVHKPDRIP